MSSHDSPIEIRDKNNVIRIRIGIGCDDSPCLSLNDVDGCERILLALDSEGNGSIGFRASNGQPIASFGVSAELGTGMRMLDVEAETWLTLRLANGKGELTLDTPSGIQAWPGDTKSS